MALTLFQFRTNASLTKEIYDRTLEPLCKKYHITRMELDILLFLANNPSYDTARDIIEQKRFTKSHVSSSLKLLEEKNLLARSHHPGNRKTVHLKLLPAASQMIAEGQQAQRDVFDRIFAGLSQEEISTLELISEKISTNILNTFKEDSHAL